MGFRIIAAFLLCYIAVCQADFQKKQILSGKTVFVSKMKKNWFDAKDYCLNKGYTLATVKSAKENGELTNVLKTMPVATHTWIGGIRHPQENNFRWEDTQKQIDSTVYTNWEQGEPNNGRGVEFCIEYWNDVTKKIEWKWNDNDCKKEQIFVCEKRE
uniref:Putative c-type lectin n=1 Tax=Nyssomyia neivai TaxID=330878 RepID=A0A1L8DQ22_9DIPT